MRRVERGKRERRREKGGVRAGHLLPLFSCFEVGHACIEEKSGRKRRREVSFVGDGKEKKGREERTHRSCIPSGPGRLRGRNENEEISS